MDANKSEYFETVEEQIKTNGIVTFKWLSRTLKIHNTLAKKVLQTFVDKANKADYIVTLAVYGKKSNGDLLLSLVKETDLDSLKSTIDVLDQHVYSIQPSDSVFDPNLVYNIDKATYELKQLSLSSIKYNKEIIRKARAVPVISTAIEPKRTSDTLSLKKKEEEVKHEKPSEPESTTNEKPAVKNESAKKTVVAKSQASSVKGNISSFFQKQSASKSVKKVEDSPTETANKALTPNGNSDDKEPKLKPGQEALKLKPPKEEPKLKSDKEEEKENEAVEKSSPKVQDKPGKASKSKKKKAAKKSTKKEQSKRRRILEISDSSSDGEDSEESQFSEPEMMPEPEPESPKDPEPETPTVSVSGKKRKRKVVDKTVMDDDGYMHTSKEVVYESCDSDEDENAQNSENIDTNKRVKISENQETAKPAENTTSKQATAKKEEVSRSRNAKTKQSSIMNFFKKPQKT